MRRRDRRWGIEKGCMLIGETAMDAEVDFFFFLKGENVKDEERNG